MVFPLPDAPAMPTNAPGREREVQRLDAASGLADLVGGVVERDAFEHHRAFRKCQRASRPRLGDGSQFRLQLDHLVVGWQREGHLLQPLLDLSYGPAHSRDDQQQRDQHRGRYVQPAESNQQDRRAHRRRQQVQGQSGMAALTDRLGLARGQFLQSLAELARERSLQILADRELQAAEELRRGVEQR